MQRGKSGWKVQHLRRNFSFIHPFHLNFNPDKRKKKKNLRKNQPAASPLLPILHSQLVLPIPLLPISPFSTRSPYPSSLSPILPLHSFSTNFYPLPIAHSPNSTFMADQLKLLRVIVNSFLNLANMTTRTMVEFGQLEE
eukprot:TRINITY_DN8238_c0_g2_i1.p1 TRINITY_DN8238_c0_g2~~TRINITY_DN8238_c0_g2_i1.p1  ORF type:complete len:139 (+),score=1.88 TRINITY_DN8238_c0_g2_i1:119-535(+)